MEKQCNKCDKPVSGKNTCWCKEHLAEYMRKYRQRVNAKNYYRENETTRNKQRSRSILQHALRSGKIKRLDHCEECQVKESDAYLQGLAIKPLIKGHHEDYSKPLSVIWLCRKCHIRADKRLLARNNKVVTMSDKHPISGLLYS